MSKEFYLSKTINFFVLVLVGGGLDVIDQLVRQESIDWRSVAIAVIALMGIALRIITKNPVSLT